MASALYNSYKQSLLDSSCSNLSSATVKVDLIDTADYVFDATDDFYDDVEAHAGGTVATGTLDSKTITDGVFDAADEVLTSVTGDPCEALILWVDTGGASSTDPLVAYIDGISVTPNGGDITIVWDSGANKIFAF